MINFFNDFDNEPTDETPHIMPIFTEIKGEELGNPEEATDIDNMPILALRNMVLFPGITLPVAVGRHKSLNLVQDAQKNKTKIGVVCQVNGKTEDPGFKDLYHYLSETYYYKKKKWNYVLAKVFSFIAAPFVYHYYRGLKLISIYDDYRFINTIKEAYTVLNVFKENIVIFPEDSSNGYFDKLTHFYSGFILICDYAYKKGLDLDIFVCYLNKKTKKYIIDKPIKYSSLLDKKLTREEIVDSLLNRCNELGNLNY